MSRILSKKINLDTPLLYEKEILNEVEETKKQTSVNGRKPFDEALKKLNKETRRCLKYAGFSENEAKKQIVMWDNHKTKHVTRYNLAYGKYIENIIMAFLELHNIKTGFGAGSKECIISVDSGKMKDFDVTLRGNKLTAGADVKNATKWRSLPGNWYHNIGLTEEKLREIRSWGLDPKVKCRSLLILYVSEMETIDILDKIFVVDVGKLVDSKMNIKMSETDDRLRPHPWRGQKVTSTSDNKYKDDAVVINLDCDGQTVVSFKDFVKAYGAEPVEV